MMNSLVDMRLAAALVCSMVICLDLNLWSIRTVLATEPFIAMTIDPGGEFPWKTSCQYYIFPSASE
ncbi:MAG: hypothetical protein DMG90_21615 [Acidobacteria bacterium]|nr:MAG: hypothetical protein DMG90_21615 [Acidobacteriota bacterium]